MRSAGEISGEVFGIAVCGRSVIGNLLAGLRTIIGGEIAQGIAEIVAYGAAVRLKRTG